jgi:molybdopterin/thiamine biosynthesis adenylyltransferase
LKALNNRLLRAKVLIVQLTGSNTELSKNLILSGASILIFDEGVVTEVDADTNFLFSKADIG